PGVASGQPATLRVLAWIGNAPDFASAVTYGEQFWPWNGHGAYAPPTLSTFVNPTGGASPASLDGMPAMLLIIPEPSIAALAGLGVVMLFLWRKKHPSRCSSPSR